MEVEASVKIVKGQRIVYTGDMCNASGAGAVVAVNAVAGGGGRMYSMNWGGGKMVPIDSSFTFDVALEDGRLIRGMFISSVGESGGCRFRLADGIASDEEIAGLLAGVALKKAADEAKAKAAAEAMAIAKAEALAAGLKLGLIPEAEFQKSGKRGSAAAFNLRAELKAAGIKASVKQDGYSCINVWVPIGFREKADEIGAKYKAGNFDGMTDCYDYKPGAWGLVFGDVQYVFCYVSKED